MQHQPISKNDYHLFGLKSLLWLLFGWTGFLLTLVGFFHAWLVWGIFFAGMLFLVRYFLKNKSSLLPSTELLVVSITLLLVVIGLSFFTTPTIFSGRDQGSISEAAIRLAQNHTLNFSTPASQTFSQIHGEGRALNFPGFFYTAKGGLVTQFPLVYTAWLASFYGIFGLVGLTIANAVALLWFLFSFYFLARLFMPARSSAIGLFFAVTSLLTFWLPKYTLSENLALPLLWLGIFGLLSFLKEQTKLNLALLFASLILLIFTRIEGIAFFLTSLAILFYHQEAKSYLKKLWGKKFIGVLLFLLFVVLANFFWETNFYKEIIKAILPTTTAPLDASAQITAEALPSFYLSKIFGLYGMLGFFILSTVACVLYALRRKFTKLIPFLIIAPTLLYFFDSHISPDHPWMLRRFAFSLLPAAIFYCTLLIGDFDQYLVAGKKNQLLRIFPIALASLLILTNMPAFWHLAFLAENQPLLEQTRQLSKHFSDKDLILVDRLATGDGWSMLTGPLNFLEGKNAVYFFNLNDLSKLNTKKFESVYLLTPTNRNGFYLNSAIGSFLTPVDKFTLTTSRLNLKKATNGVALAFPNQQTITVPLTIFRIQ
ncbi:MAG: hypothetical protein WCJ51_00340 [Candidatus Moraniibacteriota bacterium]